MDYNITNMSITFTQFP